MTRGTNQPETTPYRHARSLGLLCALLSLVCAAGFLLTTTRAVLVHSGPWVIGAESGCLVLGRATPLVTQYWNNPLAITQRLGLVTHSYRDSSFAAAWRPFRAGGATESRFLFPLWQPMLALGLGAAYSFGALAGVRRARRGVCGACGYDLIGLAPGTSCPECGMARKIAAAPV